MIIKLKGNGNAKELEYFLKNIVGTYGYEFVSIEPDEVLFPDFTYFDTLADDARLIEDVLSQSCTD